MVAIELLPTDGSLLPICAALGVSRASYYRRKQAAGRPSLPPASRTKPPRSLVPEERQVVLDALHSGRFVDRAPAEVYATLLDENTYLCSIRTMYRILDDNR